MTKKSKDNGIEAERKDLFILQLKIVALNNNIDALNQRKVAISHELNALSTKLPEVEQERNNLLEAYKPRYEELKATMEVPEGSDVNLETGEVVANPTK